MCSAYTGETAAAMRPARQALEDRRSVPVAVQALMLPDRVGYVRVDYFWPLPRAAAAIGAAFDQLAAAEALIIDLRANAGGDAATAATLGSLLFDTEPAFLAETYAPNPPTEAPAVAAMRLTSQPVIVLLSSRSSHEAWCFARNLREVGRVVIAGELPPAAQLERGAAPDMPMPSGVALRRSHLQLASADR